MSAADANAEDAFELLRTGETDRATVLALLAIRWELRTANLIAVAALGEEITGGPGRREQAQAMRAEIRGELDLDLDDEADR